MEKIYMNDNDKKTARRKRQSQQSKQSIVGSVVIAFVAMLALVVVGFNQISFAIPEEGETILGDGFVSLEPTENPTERAYGEPSAFGANQFYTKDGNIVFCLERDVDYLGNKNYSKDEILNDAGLMYILASVYPNEEFAPDLGTEARLWLSQTAIWIYAHNNGYINNSAHITDEDVTKIYNDTKIYLFNADPGVYVAEVTADDIAAGKTTLYKKYGVDKILEDAQSLKDKPVASLRATKRSDNISMTNDNKYFQTDYIDVVSTVSSDKLGKFNAYKININKAPAGTFVIDTEGKKIDNIDNLPAGTSFALRVPIDNVNNNNINMEISVLGSFESYVAHKYIALDSQTVTAVKKINNNISVPLNVQLRYTPRVPDTALSDSKPLFFIGVILLLSGLGIFYTSAKKD